MVGDITQGQAFGFPPLNHRPALFPALSFLSPFSIFGVSDTFVGHV